MCISTPVQDRLVEALIEDQFKVILDIPKDKNANTGYFFQFNSQETDCEHVGSVA